MAVQLLVDSFDDMRDVKTKMVMTDSGVPFTNNLAEQALRMAKVRQKVSGCFRTREGADVFFTIRSYLATMHKQRTCLFECLISAFKGQPVQPCLLG